MRKLYTKYSFGMANSITDPGIQKTLISVMLCKHSPNCVLMPK